MKYIDCYIDNKIKININKKYDKKIFIFLVYMSRIFFEELNNIENKTLEEKQQFNKKILIETLSNLTGYYQIFIDNLKGDPNLKIENIFVINKKELFYNLINPYQQLKSNLYNYLSYFKYNIVTSYKGITNNNYTFKLCDLIYNNKKLLSLINETIFKQSFEKDDEDLISNIFKSKDLIKGNDIEILALIKNYFIQKYSSQLTLFLFRAQKDQFFSSLLTNSIKEDDHNIELLILEDKKDFDKKDNINININNNKKEEEEILLNNTEIQEKTPTKKIEEKKIISNGSKIQEETLTENIAKLYLEKVIYDDGKTKVKHKLCSNKVEIILGFKIPGIKPIFDTLLNCIKENILQSYIQNENELRNFIDDDDEVEENEKIYFEKLLQLNKSLYILILKDKRLNDILDVAKKKKRKKKELFQLILNDYYYFFLINNICKSKSKIENQEDLNNHIYI